MAFYIIRDKRYLTQQWSVVRNYDEFIKSVEKQGIPAIVSFDHDLGFEHYDLHGSTDFLTWEEYYISGDREMTGYDCAKWLCDYCLENKVLFPDYIVHSANTIGTANIKAYIANFLKHNPLLKK
jgi:hypothetical protein